MRAKESILVLDNFSILESKCSVIPWPKNHKEENSRQNSVDIDFDILNNKEDKNKHMIVATVELNSDKNPGYCAKVKGVAVFVISDASAPMEIKKQLMFSGISICVTNIRSYIANLTSYYPLGKYNFPAIDMNDLFEQKSMKEKKQKN